MSNSVTAAARITSLDQFRGYSVAAMFVVNFVQHMNVAHQMLRHNNTHFSYADSIMPSFILACGFAYRMSYQKFFEKSAHESNRSKFYKRIAIRSLALILVSVMFFGFNTMFTSYREMSFANFAKFIAELSKANMWEVLAIIGACQIFILPVLATSAWVRSVALVLLSVLHVALSWSFNYDFVYGHPNWMDAYSAELVNVHGTAVSSGSSPWSQIMLVGTIAFDITRRWQLGKAVAPLMLVGALMMSIGYTLSCLTRLYDVGPRSAVQVAALASSPVLPDFTQITERTWASMLAEAPFVVPPSPKVRVPNYWMMDKRVVSASFVFFSGGFALALYGLFVLACDVLGWNLGIFRTFGQNPLAAYIIHHIVAHSWLAIVPRDSSLAWVLVGLCGSFGITYLFVKYLENRGLFLRL